MLNTKKYIEIVNKKFNNFFDYSLCEYTGTKNIIIIICPIHGMFEITAANHKRSKDGGCKECQKDKLRNNDYFEQVKKIHNNFYDYSKSIYKNNRSKITITCPIHGDFEQYAKNHLKGHGCQKCGIDKSRLELEYVIEQSNIIHDNFYDYNLVVYVNKESDVKILCPIHGVFKQSMAIHMKGSGCSKCDDESRRLTNKEYIEKSIIKHNNKYDYSKTNYIDCRKNVIITCQIHGDFEQNASNHLYSGNGCPFCYESKGEEQVKLFLENNNINYSRQHKFEGCVYKNKLPFDFYLPDYNMCIEYDGIQHFVSSEFFGGEEKLKYIQNNDKIKNEYCNDNNIRLIRIKYNKNVVFILNSIFN